MVTDVDGKEAWYSAYKTTSRVLHCISHNFDPGEIPSEPEYVVPTLRGRDVFVYVLERTYSKTDVSHPQHNCPALTIAVSQ